MRIFFACLVLVSGCASDPGSDPVHVTEVESPVLEIVPRDLADTVVMMGGRPDAELLRFDVVNHGDRDAVLRSSLRVYFRQDRDARSEVCSFTYVKFVVTRVDYMFFTSQQNLSLVSFEGRQEIFYPSPTGWEAVPLPAGETTTFALRADIDDNYCRSRVTLGRLAWVVSADTHESILRGRLRRGRVLSRTIDVR